MEKKKCFEWLPNFNLCAIVDNYSQKLLIEHHNDRGEIDKTHTISCFNMVTNMQTERGKPVIVGDFHPIDSKELRQQILPEDFEFSAFSWTQGIAEAGEDAIRLSSDIESKIGIPLAHQLSKFVANDDPKYAKIFINRMLSECKFENNFHHPCLVSNLSSFVDLLPMNVPLADLFKFPRELIRSDVQALFNVCKGADQSCITASIQAMPKRNQAQLFYLLDPDKVEDMIISPDNRGYRLDPIKPTIVDFKKYSHVKSLAIEHPDAFFDPDIGNLSNLEILNLNVDGEDGIRGNTPTIPDTFGDLTNLKKVSALYREFTHLPESVQKWVNLQVAEFPENHFTTIDFLASWKQLVKADFKANRIMSIPDVQSLSHLTDLDLSQNNITKLSPSMSGLTALKNLNLHYNSIKRIDPVINQLTNLKTLDLSYNNLFIMDDVISANRNGIVLPELERLDLSHNEWESFRAFKINTPKLTELNLGYNRLRSIPNDIFNLTSLRTLNLAANKMEHLVSSNPILNIFPNKVSDPFRTEEYNWIMTEKTKEWTKLQQLTDLDVSENGLLAIPPVIGDLTQLKRLNLDKNYIATLPSLPALDELKLNKNRLAQIPILPSLRRLEMNHNLIQQISTEITALTNLEYLSLKDNPLTVIPETLCNLPKLIHLNIPVVKKYPSCFYCSPDHPGFRSGLSCTKKVDFGQ